LGPPSQASPSKFVFDEKEEHPVYAGDAVVVPAGTYHNVVNASKTAMLKLYTIYSPPNHPDRTVHKTKAEAEAAELVETSLEHPALNVQRGMPAVVKQYSSTLQRAIGNERHFAPVENVPIQPRLARNQVSVQELSPTMHLFGPQPRISRGPFQPFLLWRTLLRMA